MKSAVETLSPTRAKLTVEVPFEELKPSLDAAYKKIAAADQRARLPQGQGPADGDRPADRPRPRARRGDQRRAAEAVRPGAAGQRDRAAGAARDRHHEVRGQRVPRVHRRGRRPSRDHAARARRPRGAPSTTSRSPTRTSTRRSTTCASASPPSTTSTAPPPTATSSPWTSRPCRDGEVVEGAEVSGMSYQVGRGGMLDGLDEALRRHERRRREDLPLHSSSAVT